MWIQNDGTTYVICGINKNNKKEHINFCDIENYNPYTGYIYSYELNGNYYIGSTRDLNKRKQEHRDCARTAKARDTKFNTAIKNTVLINSITKY